MKPQQGSRSVWKLFADGSFIGRCFAAEMCRGNRAERTLACFCWRRARALKSIFHFITSPPWFLTDHVRLPRQVEYLLDICREGVANVLPLVSTAQGSYRKCVLSVCLHEDIEWDANAGGCSAFFLFFSFFHLIRLMGKIRGMSWVFHATNCIFHSCSMSDSNLSATYVPPSPLCVPSLGREGGCASTDSRMYRLHWII